MKSRTQIGCNEATQKMGSSPVKADVRVRPIRILVLTSIEKEVVRFNEEVVLGRREFSCSSRLTKGERPNPRERALRCTWMGVRTRVVFDAFVLEGLVWRGSEDCRVMTLLLCIA